MSLGSLVRLWGAVAFEPELGRLDDICRAGHQLRRSAETWNHWETNRLSVTLRDTAGRKLMSLGHRGISYETINPDDLERVVGQMAADIHEAIRQLKINGLTRMGFQLCTYKDIGIRFDELLARFKPLCLPSRGKLEEIATRGAKDLSLVVDYEAGGLSAKLRAGPMKQDQGLRILGSSGSHESLFEPLTKSKAIADLYDCVPEDFLFFDVDVFREGDIRPDEWTSFVDDAKAHACDMLLTVENSLLEKEE